MDPEKSILFIGSFLSTKGSNQSVSTDILDRLADRGWRGLYSSSYRNKAIRLMDMVFSTVTQRKIYHIASIEVFSGQAFIFAEILSLIFTLLEKPFVCTLHGGRLVDFEGQNRKRVWQLLHRATRVVTPSQYLQNHFKQIRSDIIRIPNGIDLNDYEYHLRERPAPKLIWLRALHEIYAPTMAVEILHLLRDLVPEISLTMIGPDKGDGSLEKVKALAVQYDLDDQVHIIGGVSKQDVPWWLNQGDIFINTTRIESFGISVMEAAACGLPIVTTDAGELPFMWENGIDSLVVPVDNAKAMADAVERILTEPDLARQLSANARKKAKDYDWSLIMPQWEALFESLINHE